MENIVVRTWNEKDSLTLKEDCLELHWLNSDRVIPLNQIISFEVKDPKGRMRPGMITIRLAGSSGTSLRLTSFLSVGNTNNVEFPHGYAYLEAGRKMKDYISSYTTRQPAAPTQSTADEILKFKELMDMGIITAEEFEAKKKQLLGL